MFNTIIYSASIFYILFACGELFNPMRYKTVEIDTVTEDPGAIIQKYGLLKLYYVTIGMFIWICLGLFTADAYLFKAILIFEVFIFIFSMVGAEVYYIAVLCFIIKQLGRIAFGAVIIYPYISPYL